MTYQAEYIAKLHPRQQRDLAPETIYNYANQGITHNLHFTQYTAIQIFMVIDLVMGDMQALEVALDAASAVFDPYRDQFTGTVFGANPPTSINALWDLVFEAPDPVINFSSHKRTSTELYPLKTLLTKAASFRNWTKKINKAIAACKPVAVIAEPTAIAPVQETAKTSAQAAMTKLNKVLIAVYNEQGELEAQPVEMGMFALGDLASNETEPEITTCQICGRPIKSKSGKIAHHGYKEQGHWGTRTSSCQGARHLPYEKSCERIKSVIAYDKREIASTEAALTAFVTAPPDKLEITDRVGTKTYDRPIEFTTNPKDYDSKFSKYGRLFHSRKEEYERTIEHIKNDIAYLENRLAKWVAPKA